jgi:hypothetical protein
MSKSNSGRWVSALPAQQAYALVEVYRGLSDNRRFMDALDVFEVANGGMVCISDVQAERILKTLGPIVKFDKSWTFEKWMDGLENAV